MAEINGTNADETLDGTNADETIDGSGGDDSIDGSGGDDNIDGGRGDDDIEGGRGDDDIEGGRGDDTIDGSGGDDTIDGSGGDDSIDGSGGDDSIDGSGGDDTITGGGGADDIEGGRGDDEINGGGGADDIEGGRGDDTIDGSGGDDTITGGGGADDIEGGGGDDEINGGRGADDIDGGGGDDTITGGRGADDIEGNNGDDTITGGGGDDTIDGNGGNDVIDGNSGDDVIDGSGGSDSIDGGSGDDSIDGNGGRDTIDGGSGDDTINGGAGNDLLVGTDAYSSDVDTFYGNGGADTFVGGEGEVVYYIGYGDQDKGIIKDFGNGDKIQLFGTPDDYTISSDGTDTSIFYNDDTANGDLVFEVEGVELSDLTDTDIFTYIPPNALESDYTIFSRNVGYTDYTVELADSQAVYKIYKIDGYETHGSLNDFLTDAVLELGGTVVKNGTINASSLEHFGGNHNPSIRQNDFADDVVIKIAGSGVGGQFKADFDNNTAADAFQEFAQDLLGKDPRKTKIFEFNGGTNGGNNRIRIFTNDEIVSLNPELSDGLRTTDSLDFTWSGDDASGTERSNNFDDFIGEMGDLFGGQQSADADIHVIPFLNEAELMGTEVAISNGIGATETWNFGSEQEAQNFLSFFDDVVGAFNQGLS
ncbi:calcium-binding protein [Okeania sp. SIO2B3]|uniref:calcium-binding protein n=1 Tax=Okeania sp. SIO2B3 TaxID=2607784 RepID=UPI0013C14ED4|nr:calcium-binding protein [Okeania sp. SIO2B3]NET42697.1 calcium-binding protein [Okeania sp. SIO2B3]